MDLLLHGLVRPQIQHFWKSTINQKNAGRRHKPPYLLLYLKIDKKKRDRTSYFYLQLNIDPQGGVSHSYTGEQERCFFYALMLRSKGK